MAVPKGVEPLLPDRQSGVLTVERQDRGCSGRARTCDILLNRQALYLLSYAAKTVLMTTFVPLIERDRLVAVNAVVGD